MKPNPWLIRREFWENRAIWILPAVLGGLMVLAALFGRVNFITLDSPLQSRTVGLVYFMTLGLSFYAVMSVYSAWYLMDCLYADRKDRSILFWKSLPISDTQTVLSKLAVAVIVIPLVYVAAADVTTLLTAFIISVRASSAIGGALWHADLWLQMQVLWLYAIIASAIWYLPFSAWLLFTSAWAKRAVILWSLLPLVAGLLERWFFGSHVIGTALLNRLLGFSSAAYRSDSRDIIASLNDAAVQPGASVLSIIDARAFLVNPETWIGAAVGAVLIAGAIQLRLRRSEI